MKVFGADHLRKTKFLLPVGEAEVFLDELQKIVPYSLKDFFSAAKAGMVKGQQTTCTRCYREH